MPAPSPLSLEGAAAVLIQLERRARRQWTREEFERVASRRLTAPRETIELLARAQLVTGSDGTYELSQRGRVVLAKVEQGSWATYGQALLETGAFNDEIELVVQAGSIREGMLECPFARLRRQAPRVAALLGWNSDYRDGTNLTVPLAVLETVIVLTTLRVDVAAPDWVRDQQTVGRRAEVYTLRRERSRNGIASVLDVARDSGDRFGFDVEVTGPGAKIIEVKGSRSANVRFVLTRREVDAAHKHSDRHELHFWGEISLAREPVEEYDDLVARGYPLIVRNLASDLDAGRWSAVAQSWLVSRTDAAAGADEGQSSNQP